MDVTDRGGQAPVGRIIVTTEQSEPVLLDEHVG
jgi:hypothetical protein